MGSRGTLHLACPKKKGERPMNVVGSESEEANECSM